MMKLNQKEILRVSLISLIAICGMAISWQDRKTHSPKYDVSPYVLSVAEGVLISGSRQTAIDY